MLVNFRIVRDGWKHYFVSPIWENETQRNQLTFKNKIIVTD